MLARSRHSQSAVLAALCSAAANSRRLIRSTVKYVNFFKADSTTVLGSASAFKLPSSLSSGSLVCTGADNSPLRVPASAAVAASRWWLPAFSPWSGGPPGVMVASSKPRTPVRSMSTLSGDSKRDALELLRRPDAPLDAVYAALAPRWRAAAERTAAARKQLKKTRILMHEGSVVTAAEAARLRVKVLCTDDADKVLLGVFRLPALPDALGAGPKGFYFYQATDFFLHGQRSELSHEFVQAMRDGKRRHARFGTLLSGPAGVGKSAVGVQAAITCFAQDLIVVYIESASAWVTAAEQGRGHDYFLRKLLQQNADLIAADPILRSTLAPALGGALDLDHCRDASTSFRLDGSLHTASALMDALFAALDERPGPAIGVIVDAAENITEALARARHGAGSLRGMSTSRTYTAGTGDSASAAAAAFFLQWQWQTWGTKASTKNLVRMDIASCNGKRELDSQLKRHGDEAHRLRIVKPWTAEVVAAALCEPASPTAMKTKQMRDRLAAIAGGMPRTLFRGKQLMAEYKKGGAGAVEFLRAVEEETRVTAEDRCSRWFKSLSDSEKQNAADAMLSLLRGQVTWDRVKGLYDDGLVARYGDSDLDDDLPVVAPVSAAAASAIIAPLAAHLRAHARNSDSQRLYLSREEHDSWAVRNVRVGSLSPSPLSTPSRSDEHAKNKADRRDRWLKRQVLAALENARPWRLYAKAFDGKVVPDGRDVDAQAHFATTFDSILKDVTAHATVGTLYIPRSDHFPCDAITVPARCSKTAPILLWDVSAKAPTAREDEGKIDAWFAAGGIIEQLQAVFPRRSIACALCWDGELPQGEIPAQCSRWLAMARAASSLAVKPRRPSVRIVVIDRAGLEVLQVACGVNSSSL